VQSPGGRSNAPAARRANERLFPRRDAKDAFLRVDQDSRVVAAVESANAAASGLRFTYHMPGHLSKEYPHRDAIKNLVARRTGSGDASGHFVYIKGEKVWKPYKNNGNGLTNNAGKGNSSTPASGAGAGASSTNAALVPSIASESSTSTATDSAVVAASFLPQVMSPSGPSSCCKAIKILVSAGCPTRVYISVPDAIAKRTVISIDLSH